jgi:hypothetical protein
VEFAAGEVRVEHDVARASHEDLAEAIAQAGYEVTS